MKHRVAYKTRQHFRTGQPLRENCLVCFRNFQIWSSSTWRKISQRISLSHTYGLWSASLPGCIGTQPTSNCLLQIVAPQSVDYCDSQWFLKYLSGHNYWQTINIIAWPCSVYTSMYSVWSSYLNCHGHT